MPAPPCNERVVPLTVKSEEKKSRGSKISFNQVITVLGILGISIGAVSFFFYAIARGWIGETLQVGIGVLVGLVLFTVAYLLREKNQSWSNIVFGGAYFLEYLSIGIGVSVYEVIPASFGVVFGFLILASSMALSIRFSSRAIAYFSLVGGFLIPIITDTFEIQIFVMTWYLLILAVLSIISVSFNWSDLRAVMLILVSVFMYASFRGLGTSVEFLFLALYFVAFNISSLANAVLHDKKLNSLDSVILGMLPILFLPLVYNMIDSSSGALFGLIATLFSFVYLLEALYLKSKGASFLAVKNTLVSVGVIVLNIGIYLLFNDVVGLEFFIIFFIVEWILFSYMSSVSKEGVHGAMGILFLALIAIWYFFVLNFESGVGHATFFMIVLAIVPIISLIYFRSDISYKLNAATFIISGYLFLYSFFEYMQFFVSALPFREIILSVLWLIYTLALFIQVQTSQGKLLVGFLLGITLIKIAFRDLLYLEGAYRIVGFILFGVLLLIGGYFLDNEKK